MRPRSRPLTQQGGGGADVGCGFRRSHGHAVTRFYSCSPVVRHLVLNAPEGAERKP